MASVTKFYNSSGTYHIQFPQDVATVAVEGYGPGGAGAERTLNGNGGGGSGGSYAKLNAFAVSYNTFYSGTVGNPGNTSNNANATNTTFNTTSLVAKGGLTANFNNATGQAANTGSTGDVVHDGGAGASGALSKGGGGGSSGGTAANGRAGQAGVGGGNGTDSANLPAGAGAGGNGAATAGAVGTIGSFPGGAGGGATRNTTTNRLGGNGAQGQLKFTYTTTAYTDQHQDSEGANFGFGQIAGVNSRGMRFTPTNSDSLVALGWSRNKGSLGLKVFIGVTVGNLPVNDASAIYTFTIPATDIDGNYQEFFLPVPQKLVGGTEYYFYLKPWDVGGTNAYADDYQDVHGVASGSNELTDNTPDPSWSNEANLAFHFATIMQNLVTTSTATFTADGIILVTGNTKTFTADGIMKVQGNTKTFTADGVILSRVPLTFTTDGVITQLTYLFSDDFSTAIGFKWNDWGFPQFSIVNQQLVATSTLAGGYFGMDSYGDSTFNPGHIYDMRGSYIQSQLVDAGNQALTSWEVYPVVGTVDDGVFNNQIHWLVALGTIYARSNVAGSNTVLASATYNAAVHKWFRIRESGGTTFWDYSTDGVTWTNFASVANPFALNHMRVGLQIGTWQAESSTTTATFDNYNVVRTNLTFTADGVIKVTGNTKTFTADGIVRVTTPKTFTTDGVVLVAGNTKTVTTDGIVLATTLKTFTTDALVLARTLQTFTADGIVLATTLKTFTADAIILSAKTQTFTTDGIVLARTTLTFTTDGIIKVLGATKTFTTDGKIAVRINFVPYPSFEGDTPADDTPPTGWTLYGSYNGLYKGVIAENGQYGTNTFKVSSSGGADGGIRINVPVISGQEVTFSVWVKSTVDVDTGSFVVSNEQNGSGGTQTTNSNWTGLFEGRRSITITPNADHMEIFLGQGSFGPASAGTVWFDGVMLEIGATAHDYFDGDRTNAEWEGTARASISALYAEITEATFTVDGIIAVSVTTSTQTFTADGMVLATTPKTFTTDGIVLAQGNLKTFTTDGIIKVLNNVFPFTADGIVKATALATFTTDGIVKATQTQTFTTDGIIKVTGNLFTFTVDALVDAVTTKTFTTDGIVRATQSLTFTTDAIIDVTGNTKTFTADGIVKATQTFPFTTDAIVKKQGNLFTFTVDGLVLATKTQTFTTDGIVKAATPLTFTADGVIFAKNTATFTTDAIIITSGASKSFTADGLVFATNTFPFTTDGLVRDTFTQTFTTDGIVRETKTATFTADGIVLTKKTQTFTVDGIVDTENVIFTFTVDGVIKATTIKLLTVDAIIDVLGNLQTFTADGLVRETKLQSFTTDGIIFARNTQTFSADGVVLVTGSTQSFTLDAIIIANHILVTFTADGYVSQVTSFTVDAMIINVQYGAPGGRYDADDWLGHNTHGTGLYSPLEAPKSTYTPISALHDPDETPRLVLSDEQKLLEDFMGGSIE